MKEVYQPILNKSEDYLTESLEYQSICQEMEFIINLADRHLASVAEDLEGSTSGLLKIKFIDKKKNSLSILRAFQEAATQVFMVKDEILTKQRFIQDMKYELALYQAKLAIFESSKSMDQEELYGEFKQTLISLIHDLTLLKGELNITDSGHLAGVSSYAGPIGWSEISRAIARLNLEIDAGDDCIAYLNYEQRF